MFGVLLHFFLKGGFFQGLAFFGIRYGLGNGPFSLLGTVTKARQPHVMEERSGYGNGRALLRLFHRREGVASYVSVGWAEDGARVLQPEHIRTGVFVRLHVTQLLDVWPDLLDQVVSVPKHGTHLVFPIV